ncbi:MAG: hypothetical protein IIB53_10000 [Planctomycetes bacterium]|nr:hypothetical protein [Planctomycetota bacterium]MCH8259967.1 hypothetical protein [Planctomycetota bacterium]
MIRHSIRWLALLGLCSFLFAQPPERSSPFDEAQEFGVYVQALEITVEPEDVDRFENAVGTIAREAATSDIGEDHEWILYRAGLHRYWAILFSEKLQDFDTMESLRQAFAGTASEVRFQTAVDELLETRFLVESQVITQMVNPWSTVEGMSTATHPKARVVKYAVKPNRHDEFDAAIRDYVRLLKEIEYPYPIEGFRWQFGRPGENWLVTFPDNWSDFHGVNDLDTIARQHDAHERLQVIRSRIDNAVRATTQHDLDFVASLSYSSE